MYQYEHTHPSASRLKLIGLAFLALVVFALVYVWLSIDPAGAQADAPPLIVDVPVGVSITFTAAIVGLIQGFFTPILTGLLSRLDTSDAKQALISFVIVAIMAVLNSIITSPTHTFEIWNVIILFLTTMGMHVASFLQVWKPLKAGGERAPLAGTLLS